MAGQDGQSQNESERRVYSRHIGQHIIRFIALFGIMAFDIGLLASAWHYHFSAGAMSMSSAPAVFTTWGLVLLCNLLVLPSILLEANRVEITDEHLLIQSLLTSRAVPWSAVVSVTTPLFLKFAIIRTDRCFYLINKRDMEGFPELINTICAKMRSAAN